MPLIVPLQAVPNQTVAVPLDGQSCRVNVYQRTSGVYMDVLLDGEDNPVIILNVLCEHANRIIRNAYLGFIGDFVFFDLQGASDPVYTGFGDRYQLVYLTAAEIEAVPNGV